MAGPKRTSGASRLPTEGEILDAALALLDTGGPEAASVRRIAAAVAVAPNAVYTFFPDQAAIHSALVDRLLGEVYDAGPDGRSWRTALEALALNLRGRLVAHPAIVPLVMGGPLEGRTRLLLGERVLDLLTAGGLRPAVVARGAYVVVVYLLGAIALEAAADESHVGALRPEPERIAARRAALAAIPAVAFPHTATVAPVAAGWIGTEQYLWGLHRVLDGLEHADLD